VGKLLLQVLFLWDALSDERTGLQFAVQSLKGRNRAEPVTILYSLNRDSPHLEGQVPVFIYPRKRVALGSLDSITFTLRKSSTSDVSINDIQIPRKIEIKYLGMTINSKLTWKQHIVKKRN
jgi:hypothetical protein